MTFESTWSLDRPSSEFPGSAHYSPPIGGVHDVNVTFWNVGELASNGIESIAKTGATGTLTSETQADIGVGDGLGSSTGTVVTEEFTVETKFPLVTLTSMIAPSSDRFVGVRRIPT